MSEQQSLFDDNKLGKFQRPEAGAAVTQRIAAVEAYSMSGKMRKAVYEFLQRRGDDGATDEEIQRGLNMNPSTQRPRRVELVERGAVEDSLRTRRTQSGRSAVVWRVVR